jgi:hypothetical protein
MFDHATTKTREWHETITRGDIALFRFPVADPENGAEPKIRPCLVLEIEHTVVGKRATLAFGTSTPPLKFRGYDILVRCEKGVEAAGLKKPTRFVADRRVSVSLDSADFDTRGGRESPIIGRLNETGLERMNRVRARIHAEHDIGAERRRARTSRRNVRVETRRPTPKALSNTQR